MGVWRQPHSLGGRLPLVLVGVVVLPLLALPAVVPALARAHQLAALEDRLAGEAQLVADYAATTLAREGVAGLDGLAKRLGSRSETRITIIAPDGVVLGESELDLASVGNHADRRGVRQ